MRALLAVAALVALGGCEPTPADEAQEFVKSSLRDPASAEFRKVETCASGKGFSGEVNSNNEFGGKTGFQYFIVADHEAAIGFGDEKMSRLQATCYGKKFTEQDVADVINEVDAASTNEAARK